MINVAVRRFMPGASLANVLVSSRLFRFGTMKLKTVVITGCTRALGRAMIHVFIDAGWQVDALRADGVEQRDDILRTHPNGLKALARSKDAFVKRLPMGIGAAGTPDRG